MRKMIALAALSVVAAVLVAQSGDKKAKETPPSKLSAPSFAPLSVKTGLWQMTQTITWIGLPPQLASSMSNGRAVNYQSCVKQADLTSNPFDDGSGSNCHWTTLTSDGTDMTVAGDSCDMGKEFGMTSSIKGTIHVIDSQNGTGTFDITLTGNGQTMQGHASYKGRWSAPSCPSNVN